MPAKTFRGFWKRWRGSASLSNLTDETRFALGVREIAGRKGVRNEWRFLKQVLKKNKEI
jgi:hypothetical protein